uniref:Uncharacterized protein n=1 Tax=Cyprinus carpio TaxID=7962 RepID=A0A8C1XJB4_CYPCA
MHKNQAKQEVILKLSEKFVVFGEDQHCTNGLQSEHDCNFTLSPNMIISLFQDDLKAYKTQNQYLNSEIYHLTTLWRKSCEQEQSLIVKVNYFSVKVSSTRNRHIFATVFTLCTDWLI